MKSSLRLVIAPFALLACSSSVSSEPGGEGIDAGGTNDGAFDSAFGRDEGVPGDTSAAKDSSSSTDSATTMDGAPSDSIATGCITDTSAGTHVFTCDGFKYDVTIPPACTSGGGKCGLVLDVHGATMSGKMEDNNTNMRALGAKFGYVVVQPNANPAPPSSSWNPGTDDDKVFAFLKLAISSLSIDDKRVHMTGFSQGGMMSSRFLCKHADVFASIAPAAGTGCSFTGADTPSMQIPVLYMHGTSDALVSFSAGTAQRDALIAAWKMTGETVVDSDAKHKHSRWTNASGTTFEFIQHDYQASSFVLRGHCYPGSKDLKGGEPGQLFGFACTDAAAFTWGDVVMQFFVDHPRK
jgi:polyhydroxybutyrate depolymerase